jgi:ubiquinone/menaquinone biosynthesis C-methylase UbiE
MRSKLFIFPDGARLTLWRCVRRRGGATDGVCYHPSLIAINDVSSAYLLGSTNAEHERLIRQAMILNPFTERFFREAGIAPGQRVLDIGSGLGDVAMLAARLVEPAGTVMGVDRDETAIAKAKARVAEAGLQNVIFTESEVGQVASTKPFDAIVGRLILEFLPNPGEVISTLSKLLRAGGVLAIQDACWGPFLQLTAPLPLRSKCASLIHQAFQHSGANMDMELALYRSFQQAGFPAPSMRIEVPVGSDPVFARWIYDLLSSLHPQMQKHSLAYQMLGDFSTLLQRLEVEASAAKVFGACIGLVGAWSRKPKAA